MISTSTQSFQIHWLRVGEIAGNSEDKFDGYVWQADTSGIKAAWFAVDPQSGIKGYMISVGSHKGMFLFIEFIDLS